eukprot:951390-Heterocapsa_arctica.AAC.1
MKGQGEMNACLGWCKLEKVMMETPALLTQSTGMISMSMRVMRVALEGGDGAELEIEMLMPGPSPGLNELLG